jgi:hypothetical protein
MHSAHKGDGPDFFPPRQKFGETVRAESWKHLLGVEVGVEYGGRLVRTGFVDAASPSGDYVWIAAAGVEPRLLVHGSEGYSLRVHKRDVLYLDPATWDPASRDSNGRRPH